MRITLRSGAYAAGVDEDYKVAECRQGKRVTRGTSGCSIRRYVSRGGGKKILRIIYAPLVVRLQGKYARIGYTLA